MCREQGGIPPRPPLSTVALSVVAGWMVAGLIILGTAVVRWPPVSSPLLTVVGWELTTIVAGALLALGGASVVAAAHPGVKLSTRWRVETAGAWLLVGGWTVYGILSWRSSGAWAVEVILVGHVVAGLLRVRDIRREERDTRALPPAKEAP